MEKGKLGLRLSFYGVAAFVLAFMGHSTLLFLLLGIVLLVEKNDFVTRQVIQAICLCLVASLIGSLLDIADFMYDIPFISSIWSTILNIINSVIDLVVFIFCLVGMFNNLNGKDANIPLASKFADWAQGVVTQASNFQQNNFAQQNQGFNQGANNFGQQAQNFNQQGANNFSQQMNQTPDTNAQQPNQPQQ